VDDDGREERVGDLIFVVPSDLIVVSTTEARGAAVGG